MGRKKAVLEPEKLEDQEECRRREGVFPGINEVPPTMAAGAADVVTAGYPGEDAFDDGDDDGGEGGHDEACEFQGEPPSPEDDEGTDDDLDLRDLPSSKKPLEMLSSREIGTEGERLAAAYLRRRGVEVLECNWRCSGGEVDIVASDEDTVVLVEVKTRLALGDDAEEMPELAVDRRKQRRYRKLALLYLASHPEVNSVRFDVIALNIVGERCARLRHLIGAYEWDE